MAFLNKFQFAPAEWLPHVDTEILERVVDADIEKEQGKHFEHPDFELKVVPDVHNQFTIDLFHKIRMSDVRNEKLVIILPSPENAVFISVVENLNKYRVSCRNVHIFFLYEYANEKGQVAPWNSPYSRSGHFVRYFYERLDAELRMPWENIHFFTTENVATYSDELAALGGADVAYTAISWSGGIGAIDPDGFPAETVEELKEMGSRLVTPMPEMIVHDSLRGMFGCSGDIGNVPPCAATVGPKDLLAAKEWIDVEYLSSCSGNPSHQRFPLRLALFGNICPENPASLMRLHAGTCFVSANVAGLGTYQADVDWLQEKLDAIREKEGE